MPQGKHSPPEAGVWLLRGWRPRPRPRPRPRSVSAQKRQEEHWGTPDKSDEGHPEKTGGSNIRRGVQFPHADHWHPSAGCLCNALQINKTRFEKAKPILYIWYFRKARGEEKTSRKEKWRGLQVACGYKSNIPGTLQHCWWKCKLV